LDEFELIYRILQFFSEWRNGNRKILGTIFDEAESNVSYSEIVDALMRLEDAGLVRGFQAGVTLFMTRIGVTNEGLKFLENAESMRNIAKRIMNGEKIEN
jgi:predicted transcriptional regulator